MSQGIMERNLPVAESIGEGDKVRIVTSAGNSKNIDASQIVGGDDFTVNVTSSTQTADKTAQEVLDAYNAGKKINLIVDGTVREVVFVHVTSGPGGSDPDLYTLEPITGGGNLVSLKLYSYAFRTSGLTIYEYTANFAS